MPRFKNIVSQPPGLPAAQRGRSPFLCLLAWSQTVFCGAGEVNRLGQEPEEYQGIPGTRQGCEHGYLFTPQLFKDNACILGEVVLVLKANKQKFHKVTRMG